MGSGKNNGRGRSGGHGSGRGSSGSGRSNGQNNSSRNNNNNNEEVKFAPYQEGRVNCMTYTAVKEYIVNLMRKTFKNGNDIANYIETEDLDKYDYKPIRQIADFKMSMENRGSNLTSR